MRRKEHWERVYTTKGEHEVSWFETLPTISLEMLEAAGVTRESCILDVGGGDSRLIDQLTARGMDCLAVLDVSGAALQRARTRLGEAASVPVWIEADVTGAWTLKPMDVWHDRAVFHFLTTPEDRAAYLAHMQEILKVNGSAIIATFAPDGPEKCSGLPVARYSPESLAVTLGPSYRLLESRRHVHQTPWGTTQAFQYSRLVRLH
jgi:SAM-dependent methyltransferase